MNRARKTSLTSSISSDIQNFECEVILNLSFDFGNQDNKYKTTKQFLQNSNAL